MIGDIFVTKHAIERITERLGIAVKDAERYAKERLKRARYLGVIQGEDGGTRRVFADKGTRFLLDAVEDRLITVIPDDRVLPDLRDAVNHLLARQIKRAEREEKSALYRIKVARAKLQVERAKCEYAMTVTPSKTVRSVNEARVKAIDAEIAELTERELEAQRRKRDVIIAATVYTR